MTVNGAAVTLDTAPVIIESRTLVPIRASSRPSAVPYHGMIQRVGSASHWAERTSAWSSAAAGNPQRRTNAHSHPDNPRIVPRIINGRTLLPLRFVAESLGADVQWRAETQTVIVTWPAP